MDVSVLGSGACAEDLAVAVRLVVAALHPGDAAMCAAVLEMIESRASDGPGESVMAVARRHGVCRRRLGRAVLDARWRLERSISIVASESGGGSC